MGKRRANLSDLLNNLTFRVLFDKYKLVCLNAFEWGNLPDGIQERHIENVLFERGMVAFFRANDMGHMCLPAHNSDAVNVYGDPTGYIINGFNYHTTRNADDVVIIENNKLRIPTRDFIMFYVNKLAEIERTMDVNVKACKTPVVFACDDKDALTFKRIFQQVDGNVPAIFADRNLNMGSIAALDTKATFLGNELRDLAHSVEGDLLTFLGQNNVNVSKRERLITDEANANNELIDSFFELQYESRRRACEEINAKFGCNVSVRPRDSGEAKEAEPNVP